MLAIRPLTHLTGLLSDHLHLVEVTVSHQNDLVCRHDTYKAVNPVTQPGVAVEVLVFV